MYKIYILMIPIIKDLLRVDKNQMAGTSDVILASVQLIQIRSLAKRYRTFIKIPTKVRLLKTQHNDEL